MIVSDIRIRVKRTFGDESGVQITDDDILRWINDGMRQIVMQNEGLLEKTTLASAVSAQQEYTLPVDLLILKTIHFKYSGEQSYFKLKGLKFTEFEEYVDGWDGTVLNKGAPVIYTIHAGKIILYPTPDISITDAIKVYYTRSPVDVTTAADTPDLPMLYHESLVKYCLVQAYELDEDWQARDGKSTELNADIRLLRGRDDWKQQLTYPVITILSEDQF